MNILIYLIWFQNLHFLYIIEFKLLPYFYNATSITWKTLKLKYKKYDILIKIIIIYKVKYLITYFYFEKNNAFSTKKIYLYLHVLVVLFNLRQINNINVEVIFYFIKFTSTRILILLLIID